MVECIAFKHKDGTYTIITKKRRTDKHGRDIPLFTVDKRHVTDPGTCKIVEPYKASKNVIGNAEMKRYMNFTRRVKTGKLTRASAKIVSKLTLGI